MGNLQVSAGYLCQRLTPVGFCHGDAQARRKNERANIRSMRNDESVETEPARSVMAGASLVAIATFFGVFLVFVDFLLAHDLPALVEGFLGEE
jgi:hypothetical protein